MADYPFPGCCEHGSNSHTRERCLACDCAKGPVQGAPAQPAAQDGTVELTECPLCWAMVQVTPDSLAGHAAWHEAELDRRQSLLDTLEKALTALASLRQRLPHPTQEENPS